MAAYGWRKNHSVRKWLRKEGHRFDFFQAVRLLQMDCPDRPSVGESADPGHEAVRFGSAVDLAFPASDIVKVKRGKKDDAANNGGKQSRLAKVKVNFLSLAGATGSLPTPHTELIVERDWQGDPGLRKFLDIFNHRLVSILFRIRKTHRLGFDHKAPGKDSFSEYLFSLIGLGTPYLRDQMRPKEAEKNAARKEGVEQKGVEQEAELSPLEPRSLLHYTGLLAQHPRSLIGLEVMLADFFQARTENGVRPLPVKVDQFHGQWFDLDEGQLTRIGALGQNHCLGRDVVVLGRRVWDQQARFELRIGPLPYSRFVDFLPGGAAFEPLCQLTRFYVGDELDFTLRLILKTDEAPPIEKFLRDSPRGLGRNEGPRLGWTSWLKSEDWQKGEEDEQVKITPWSVRS